MILCHYIIRDVRYNIYNKLFLSLPLRRLNCSCETIRIDHEQLYPHRDDRRIFEFCILHCSAALLTLFATGLCYPLMIRMVMIYSHHHLVPCRFWRKILNLHHKPKKSQCHHWNGLWSTYKDSAQRMQYYSSQTVLPHQKWASWTFWPDPLF